MNIKDFPYKSNEPFPNINNLKGTQQDIALLHKAFSSCGSETTAILQYVFQSYVIKDEDIAKIIENIAMTEMVHHDYLGKAIVKLGGTPYYTNGFGGDYSTKCVFEGKNIVDMLNQNIKDEESGINYYENIKKQLSSNELVELIDRIILDEIVHVETFNKLLEYVSFYKNN